MPDVEKVITAIKHYMLEPAICNESYCSYYGRGDVLEDCEAKLAHDVINLLKEYDEALKLMVYQYCTMAPLTISDEIFHNQYMSAGEAAFRLLGIENGQSTDGVWERWFPNG